MLYSTVTGTGKDEAYVLSIFKTCSPEEDILRARYATRHRQEKEQVSTCLYLPFHSTLRKEGQGPEEPEKFFHEFHEGNPPWHHQRIS